MVDFSMFTLNMKVKHHITIAVFTGVFYGILHQQRRWQGYQ